jgi:hypothetical protein
MNFFHSVRQALSDARKSCRAAKSLLKTRYHREAREFILHYTLFVGGIAVLLVGFVLMLAMVYALFFTSGVPHWVRLSEAQIQWSLTTVFFFCGVLEMVLLLCLTRHYQSKLSTEGDFLTRMAGQSAVAA